MGKFKPIHEFAEELNEKKIRSEEFWEAQFKDHFVGGYEKNAVIGTYIGDFVFRNLKIVVEAHGNIHQNEAQKIKDKIREKKLRELGWECWYLNYPHTSIDWMLFLDLLQRLHNRATTMAGMTAGLALARENPIS